MHHTNHFAGKKRLLRRMVSRLNVLIIAHRGAVTAELRKLISRIRKLAADLLQRISAAELKKILGAAALVAGITFTTHTSAQSFAPPLTNPFGFVPAYVYAIPALADLDGDGDLDLMIGEYYGALKYYQNTGSAVNPQFAAPLLNPFGTDSTNYLAFPEFADLDNDGDQDLFVGEYYGNLQYYQNTGTATNPQFAAPVPNPFGLIPAPNHAIPALADLDDDGDFDLLVGAYYGSLHYYQNTGTLTSPAFASPLVNPFGLTPTDLVSSPAFADLDGDGDLDLLVGEYYGGLQYFQNTGTANSPQFAAPVKNPFGLASVNYLAFPAFADLDDDSDLDLLVGEYYGNIIYFENTGTSGWQEAEVTAGFEVFPNPFGDVFNIKSKEKIETVEIINLHGVSMGIFRHAEGPIRLDYLNSGTYIVKITFGDGRIGIRKVEKGQ